MNFLVRLARNLRSPWRRSTANRRGTTFAPPGHFYSPLLNIAAIEASGGQVPFDGREFWEHIDLRPDEQRALYTALIDRFAPLDFPLEPTDGWRYFSNNGWFPFSDAFTLSSILREERPSRLIEIGSGFSSAVILDTLAQTGHHMKLTFVDPFPDRLNSLLKPADRAFCRILDQTVQQVPISLFEELGAQDVLLIDSSHVAKIGSDVTLLLLRILPRLKPGVLVHFHDISYPHSYPLNWLLEGRAWNESLFLRAFLIGNRGFEMLAFNSFAGGAFPEVFRDRLPQFLQNTGGSLWLRKT